MIQPLFFVLLLFALLGDARVFLFVMNRLVFGSHRHEKSEFGWMLYAVPPLLLVLTLLFWPLHRWVAWLASQSIVDRVTPDVVERAALSPRLAQIGAAWLLIAASIGLYWVIDRLRVLVVKDAPVAGTRSFEPEIVRLRRAHVPFAWLRKLGAHNDVYDVEVTRHEVIVQGLPASFDGYRIAFLTDTHVASFVRRAFYREVIGQTMKFRPDLVLLGGDFVTWKRHIPLMAETLLGELSAPDGIFAVLGNHDYWADADLTRREMEARGARFIVNRRVEIRRGGATLSVVGIDEIYRGEPDLGLAFDGLDGSSPTIGLSHHPDVVDILDGRRIDLLVCGHTHGGQIRFPFFGSVVVPSRHEARYAAGFHRVGRVLMYVSRGIGAIPPLRILCRPEVATFVLRSSAPSPSND